MEKPENPFRKNTLVWSVMEGDWEDRTIAQIAEVLDTDVEYIRDLIKKIKKKTGYAVPYVKLAPGRKRNE